LATGIGRVEVVNTVPESAVVKSVDEIKRLSKAR